MGEQFPKPQNDTITMQVFTPQCSAPKAKKALKATLNNLKKVFKFADPSAKNRFQ